MTRGLTSLSDPDLYPWLPDLGSNQRLRIGRCLRGSAWQTKRNESLDGTTEQGMRPQFWGCPEIEAWSRVAVYESSIDAHSIVRADDRQTRLRPVQWLLPAGLLCTRRQRTSSGRHPGPSGRCGAWRAQDSLFVSHRNCQRARARLATAKHAARITAPTVFAHRSAWAMQGPYETLTGTRRRELAP